MSHLPRTIPHIDRHLGLDHQSSVGELVVHGFTVDGLQEAKTELVINNEEHADDDTRELPFEQNIEITVRSRLIRVTSRILHPRESAITLQDCRTRSTARGSIL